MNDNQIIRETWFEAMLRKTESDLDKLTIIKPVVKKIKVRFE